MASLAVLIATILVVGFFFFRVMASFLIPLFLASLLVVIFRPVHVWMLKRCKGREKVASMLTTTVAMLMVLFPAILVIAMATVEGVAMVSEFDVAATRDRLAGARQSAGLELPAPDELRHVETGLSDLMEASLHGDVTVDQLSLVDQMLGRLRIVREALPDIDVEPETIEPLVEAVGAIRDSKPGTLENESAIKVATREMRAFKHEVLGDSVRVWLADFANPSDEKVRELNRGMFDWAKKSAVSFGGSVAGLLGQWVFGIIIMVTAMYFFFAEGGAMVDALMTLSPLDDRHERELLLEFDNISRAVVLATLLSAIAQGLLAGIAYWFAGLGSVFLLTLLTATFAMVPFIGAAAIWVPCCLYLYFIEERFWPAVLLAIWGSAVVSTCDNFIKPLVLHGKSKLHPLLALLSVLGGVQALGPIGILVGPMVVVFLQTLLKILHRELLQMDETPEVSNDG